MPSEQNSMLSCWQRKQSWLSGTLQELLTELQDQDQFGKRGEAWTFAQVAAIILVLLPPFQLVVRRRRRSSSNSNSSSNISSSSISISNSNSSSSSSSSSSSQAVSSSVPCVSDAVYSLLLHARCCQMS
jgi:hypothetical protein